MMRRVRGCSTLSLCLLYYNLNLIHRHSTIVHHHSLSLSLSLSSALCATLCSLLSLALSGPQVLKVDAAGHFLPYKAVAAGKSEQEAMNFMEKKVILTKRNVIVTWHCMR